MALARFFERALDAASNLPVAPDRDAFTERITDTVLALRAPAAADDDAAHRAGFLLAANLAARLYQAIVLDAPEALADDAAALMTSISPLINLRRGAAEATVGFDCGQRAGDVRSVSVSATGWAALLSVPDAAIRPASAPAALVAACLGMAEVFRIVVRDLLPATHARRSAPTTFDLLSWSDRVTGGLPLAPVVDLGRVHLAGAGAIGEAAVLALSTLPVTGTLVAVDLETVVLSNLQRYVLARDADVGTVKATLVENTLLGHGLAVERCDTRWGADERSGPGVHCVVVALDTRRDRLGVAAGLPARTYNAWTQPLDLGWSRHERFGVEPCLACLYWPAGRRPSDHERIGAALGIASDRVAAYLVNGLPIDQPLSLPVVAGAPAGPTPPADRETWLTTTLLDDLRRRPGVDMARLGALAGSHVEEVYGAACGTGLITATMDEALTVPLAHQSALAGVMLATLVVASADLALAGARANATEGRLAILAPLPQHAAWPVARTPGCLCFDPGFGGVPLG